MRLITSSINKDGSWCAQFFEYQDCKKYQGVIYCGPLIKYKSEKTYSKANALRWLNKNIDQINCIYDLVPKLKKVSI